MYGGLQTEEREALERLQKAEPAKPAQNGYHITTITSSETHVTVRQADLRLALSLIDDWKAKYENAMACIHAVRVSLDEAFANWPTEPIG